MAQVDPEAEVITEFPETIRSLAVGESREIDERHVLARLRAAWVTSIEPVLDSGFDGIRVSFGETFVVVPNDAQQESSAPVADTVDTAVAAAEAWDLLRRLNSAWMDMDQVLHAAAALLKADESIRERSDAEGSAETEGELDALPPSEVIETGMVTLYARHFTGDRALPGRWWPRGKRKATHEWLVDRRNTVVAHADQTPARRLALWPTEGSEPVFVPVETRRGLTPDELREVVHHCEALWRRYSDAVLELKWALGLGAAGELFGDDTYDE